MAATQKTYSVDGQQALRGAFNPEDATLGVGGFLVGKAGRKITQTISTTNVPNDTATFEFLENNVLLYTLVLIYTDSTQATLISAERTV